MAVINPHTTRATGTILTATIYNADHQNHITNANNLNAELGTVIGVGAATGMIASNGAGVISGRTITPVANQTTVSNGNGVAGNPVIGIATNPTLPGNTTVTGSLTVGSGTSIGSGGTTTLNGTNATITIAPTGTGTVNINPGTAGTINKMSIGATTRSTGAFTTLDASGAVNLTSTVNITGNTIIGTGVLQVDAGQMRAADGTAALPGIAFTSQTSLGFRRVGSAIIGVMGTGSIEIARFDGAGAGKGILVGGTSFDPTLAGIGLQTDGFGYFSRNADLPMSINRIGGSGGLVDFLLTGVSIGSISGAGTTVSYNSFLASHWSQLLSGRRPKLLRGTICESIDVMSEWSGEADDRLPRFKVSDTPSSPRVYGVFLDWDKKEKGAASDAYIAAVGAGWVRMAPDTKLEGGDLIESAGNGCGRVQSDDIVRSKTVAKVTSTIPVEKFPDGSFLVPATLMCG